MLTLPEAFSLSIRAAALLREVSTIGADVLADLDPEISDLVSRIRAVRSPDSERGRRISKTELVQLWGDVMDIGIAASAIVGEHRAEMLVVSRRAAKLARAILRDVAD